MNMQNPLAAALRGDFSTTGLSRRPTRSAEYNRTIARALSQSASDTSPVQHPLQGIARVANGFFAGRAQDRADEQSAIEKAQQSAAISSLLEKQGMDLERIDLANLPQGAMSGLFASAFKGPDKLSASDLVKVPDETGGYRYIPASEATGQPAYQEPSSIQQRLQEAGYQPGTPEYQQAARDLLTKSNGVTVNMPKGADELSKLDAQYIGTLREGVQKMRDAFPDLQRVRESLDQFATGPTAGVRLFLGSLAQDLGMEVDPSISEGELVKSIQSRLAPAMRQTGSGSSSDKDVAMFTDALPNLLRTPEGNRLVIDHMVKIGNRKAQELQFMERYFRENEYSLAGVNEAMDKALGPVFTKDEIAAMRTQDAPTNQPGTLPRMPSAVPPPPENFFLVE